MKKTIVLLMLMMVLSSVSLTACGATNEAEVTVDDDSVVEEMVVEDESGDAEDEEDEDSDDDAEEDEDDSGDGTDSDGDDVPVAPPVAPKDTPKDSASTSEPTVTVKYVDGQYSASGAYIAPSGEESVSVKVTVKDDVVTGLTVTSPTTHDVTKQFIAKFTAGIDALVVGKKLDEIGSFSAVNGSSLTPKGFAMAIESIKTLAQK